MESEIQEFDKTFKLIIDKIAPEECLYECANVYKRLREVIEYNVLKGKKTRGLLVVMAFKMFSRAMNKTVTEEELRTARILGWILEILQAFALIMDDLMDQSLTRRGQKCWYKKAGINAIIDGRLLEQETHHILKIFVSDKPFYSNIIDAIHETMRLTAQGQLMDMMSDRGRNSTDLRSFKKSRLKTVYRYKTSYYTFVLPVKIAMYLSSIDQAHFNKMEGVLMEIGHLFQMQDDFLDCFGNPSVTGKVGTDIGDGKCCWPIVTALQFCNDDQRKVLEDNYGVKNEANVNAVKQVYHQINLIDIYNNCEAVLFNQIRNCVKTFETENIITAQLLGMILSKLQQRRA